MRALEAEWRTHTCPRANADATGCRHGVLLKNSLVQNSKLQYFLPHWTSGWRATAKTKMGDSAQDEASIAPAGNLLCGFSYSKPSLSNHPAPASASSRIRVHSLGDASLEGPDDGNLWSNQKAVITGPGGYHPLFYLPPYASVMINLTVLPMDARNEGEEESIGVTW